MSGFAGFFAFPDPLVDAAPLLARLGRALPVLPDAPAEPPGTLLLADGRAGLAGNRLAHSGDGTLALAFDGTILNRAELGPAALSDGELLLALYSQHGAACAERLRGPFAFALWDGRGQTLLLARDPLGLRSLHYWQDAAGKPVLFATGVRPLAASGLVPRQLDARGLYGFFRHGAVPEPFTMVAGVRALETGGRLSCRGGETPVMHKRAPWRFATSAPKDHDPTQAAKTLRAALLDSVDTHLADGAPKAIFVGGGIGSAALLALAREAGREKNLRALIMGFDHAKVDESKSAVRIAEHFGVPYSPLHVDQQTAQGVFDQFLPMLNQPGVRGFPRFLLSWLAREAKQDAAVAGIGVGELFGRVRGHALVPALLRLHQLTGKWRASLSRRLAKSARPSRQRLGDFLSRPATAAGAYAALHGIHGAAEARALVARFTDPTGCAEPTPEDVPGADEFATLDDEINALDLRRRLRDQLLRDVAVFGEAWGVEWRLPFVDVRVVETLAAIPAKWRLGDDARLLRDAVPEVKPWMFGKARSGLHFPYDAWRAGEWGAAKAADAAGARRARRTWEQKWSLFLFRRWWRQVSGG